MTDIGDNTQGKGDPPATEMGSAVDRWTYVGLFGVALVIRLLYIAQIRTIPFFETLVGDAASYDAWARRIAGGDWWGDQVFYQAPAYPYFLALLYRIFGHDLLMVRIVQAVCGAGSCVLIALAGDRLVDRRVGLIAGLLLAFYAPAIFFDGLVQKASLGLLLMTTLLWRLAAAHKSPRFGAWMLAGAVLGLLALTRENALILSVALLVWISAAYRRAKLTHRLFWSVGFASGLVIILLPVAARNRMVGGEWAITTVQAGPNFYIGNNSNATGLYTPLVRGHESPPFERADARRLAEAQTGRSMTDGDVSRYWFNEALRDISANPLGWLKLLGRKALLAINAYEITDVEGYNVYRAYSSLLGFLGLVFHFGVLLPLGVLGFACTASEWRSYALLTVVGSAMLIGIIAFYVFARYRFPLVPVLCIFAAVGLNFAWRMTSGRRQGKIMAPLLFAVGFAVLSNATIAPERQLDAMAYGNLATVLAQRGDLAAASQVYAIALEDNPASAELHYNMGLCKLALGDPYAAVEHFRTAKTIEPELIEVDYQLGVAFEQLGQTGDALRHYQNAVDVDPGDDDARAAINRLGPTQE